MKFTVAALLGAASAFRAEPVWSLPSVNRHQENIDIQKQYAEFSTGNANKLERPSDSSNVQIDSEDWYTVFDQGKTYNGAYERVIPAHFSAGSDDIFMRSVLNNYAVEKKACDDAGACKPTGSFWLNKAGARALGAEVLATHKKLAGPAVGAYLDTYFDKAWGHFDVNRVGAIEAQKSAPLMRFLCSDQRMQLGESGF